MFKIKKKTVIPIYRQVLNHIQSDIRERVLKGGHKLPPEPELAEIYGVSRVTIRKTLTQLANEGLVERRKGKGTFVKDLEKKQLADTFCILSFSTNLIESNEYDFGILRGIVKELDAKSPLTTIYWRENLDLGRLKDSSRGIFLLHPANENISEIKRIINENIPLVFLSSLPEKLKGYHTVSMDNSTGTLEAMEFLIKKGRRKIAFISGLSGKSSVIERFSAYRSSLKEYEVVFNKAYEINMSDSNEEMGYKAAKKLLALKTRPDAIFACTDLMAFGAIKAVKEAGLSVPGDISIIGFDNSRIARFTEPSLTTVESDTEKIGSEGAKLLMKLLSGIIPDKKNVIPSHLIVRDSA